MQICVLLGSDMEFASKPSESPKPSDMTPEQDALDIWSEASVSGIDKYFKGSAEHNSKFWTAGAGWYAKNLKDEQLDLISYLHHLMERIKLIQLLADMMEDDEISLRDASRLLKNLVSDSPPESFSKQSHD
jgi:hypothetical protein